MSDSARPKPPHFEIPDLELEPVPQVGRRPARAAERALGEEAEPPLAASATLGAPFDFGDELEDFEFERTLQPSVPTVTALPSGRDVATKPAPTRTQPSIPSGRAPDATKLVFDPDELARISGYGDPPDNAARSLAYAYRVFTRQRELKRQLAPIAAECLRAEKERETVLADLARELRPELEKIPAFARFLGPVLETEQRVRARGDALSALGTQRTAQNADLDAELARTADLIARDVLAESAAQREYETCEANLRRAEAKLKRVQIEKRALTPLAEQTRGSASGSHAESSAHKLAELEQRERAVQPELMAARERLQQSEQALTAARTQLATSRRNQRELGHKKQALAAASERELSTRTGALSESEGERSAALAELGRAVLASPGTLAVPESGLARLRVVSDRADQSRARAELFRRAIAAYDVRRAQQGVRLACTLIGFALLLSVFKLIF